MSLIARGVVRNLFAGEQKTLAKKDWALMLDIMKHIVKQGKREEYEFFYTAKDGENIQFIHDNRIIQMEHIAKRLFERSKQNIEIQSTIIEGESNLERLVYFENVLQSISEVLDNINIVFEP